MNKQMLWDILPDGQRASTDGLTVTCHLNKPEAQAELSNRAYAILQNQITNSKGINKTKYLVGNCSW